MSTTDFETLMRRNMPMQLETDPIGYQRDITVTPNGEGRPVLVFTDGDDEYQFIVVENTLIPVIKPQPQVMKVAGIESFGPMGAR